MAAQNASSLLAGLVIAAALFGVLLGASSLKPLAGRGYALDYGWQTPPQPVSHGGVCDRPLITKGFPLTTARPANDPTGCLDARNPLAQAMNVAICFAIASILSVGAVNLINQART